MEENQAKKNTLFGSILKALKKRLKPGHVLFLAILLGTNAFAWFIYMEKISSDINVKVKSWNVSFNCQGVAAFLRRKAYSIKVWQKCQHFKLINFKKFFRGLSDYCVKYRNNSDL